MSSLTSCVQPLPETTQGDRHARQLLADVVVQVPRNPCSLDILRLDQPASQVPNFAMTLPQCLLRLFAFGDIETAADVTGIAAIRFILRNAGIQNPSVDAVSAPQAVSIKTGWRASIAGT